MSFLTHRAYSCIVWVSVEHLSTSSSPGSPSSLEALSRPPNPCCVNAISWSAWQLSFPLEDVRPARACVTVGPRGRPGLQPASPLMRAETGSHWLLLPCMLFTHLQGALLTPRVEGRAGLPVWFLGFKLESQDTEPQAVHGPSAPAQSKGRPVIHWPVFSARDVELC